VNKQELIAFEDMIADLFNKGKIPYPVHFSNGNENALIAIFKDINKNDWVCGSWRMHYQCLLHGVPQEELKEEIMKGNSMTLCFPEKRILSSAIVGGSLSIAVGIALGIKRRGGDEKVWCFLGDMAAASGNFHEAMKYGANHSLPIHWVIEDNGVSVLTPTREVWGEPKPPYIRRYEYKSRFPHAGAGHRVQF